MNKETLQQHNTRLSENNVDLTTILNKVKELLEKEEEVIISQDKIVNPSKETQK